MTKILASLALVLLAGTAYAADVGVSVQIGQPGFYGRIDIGNAPPPVVRTQPVWVQRQPVQVQPIYMRVPPGHQKHWARHCARYNACGTPVYFVREDWYRERYAAPVEQGDGGHGKGMGGAHGHGHGHGHSHGHGHGHGHGHDSHGNGKGRD